MTFHTRTLLTLVAEASLEKDLVALFRFHQVRGWTIVAARGTGDHGDMQGDFEASGNLQFELIAEAAVAEALAQAIHQRFSPHYALIQWLSEVRVLRAEKF